MAIRGTKSNQSYTQFAVSRDQQISLSNSIEKKLLQITPTSDLSFHYQLSPLGEDPYWVKVLKNTVNNSKYGALHAIQNRKNLERIIKGLGEETAKLIGEDTQIDPLRMLNKSIKKLSKDPSKGIVFQQFLEDYSMTNERARHFGVESPRFLPDDFIGGPKSIHERLKDHMIGYGQVFRSGDGQLQVGISNFYGNMIATDSDGDQLNHVVMFTNRKTEEVEAMVLNKSPGHFRTGYFKVKQAESALEILEQGKNSYLSQTAKGSSDEDSLIEGLINQPSNYIKKMKDRAQYGQMYRAVIGGGHKPPKGFESLHQAEIKDTIKLLKGNSEAGIQHNKQIEWELYHILQELQGVPIEDKTKLNRLIASKLGVGMDRLDRLEKGLLKASGDKKGLSLTDADFEDFDLKLVKEAKSILLGYKDLPNMSSSELLDMFESMDPSLDRSALARMTKTDIRSIKSQFFESLSSALTNTKSPFEKVFKPAKKYIKAESVDYLTKKSTGIADVLEEIGFLNFNPMLVDASNAPNLPGDTSQYAVTFNTDFLELTPGRKVISPFNSETTEGYLNTSVFQSTFISNAKQRTIQNINAREMVKNVVNNTIGSRMSFLNSSFVLGETTGVFTRDKLKEPEIRRRLIGEFVNNGADLDITGLDPRSSISERSQALNAIIDRYSRSDDKTFKKFVTFLQLQTPDGRSKQAELTTKLIDLASEFASQQTVKISGKNASYANDVIASTQSGQVNIVSGSKITTIDDVAEDVVFARHTLSLSDYNSSLENNRTTKMEVADEYGRQTRLGGNITASTKRAGKITSQVQNSVTVSNLNIAFAEIDLEKQLQELDPGLTREQLKTKYFTGIDEDEIVSARNKRFGTNQFITTTQMQGKFKEALTSNNMTEIVYDGELSIEEAEELGAIKQITVRNGIAKEKWKIDLTKYDNMRKISKFVSPDGTVKIQPTKIVDSMIGKSGGYDALIFGGELAAKSNLDDLGLNVFSIAAGQKGLTAGESLDRVEGFQEEVQSIVRYLNEEGVGLTPEERLHFINVNIEAAQSKLFNGLDITRDTIDVVEAGQKKTVNIFGLKQSQLQMVINSAEIKETLDSPKRINMMAEYGQREMEKMVRNVSMFISDTYGENADEVYDQLYSTFQDTMSKTMNPRVFDNLQAISQLTTVLEGTIPDGVNQKVTMKAAEKFGFQSAVAKAIGGDIMMQTAQHIENNVLSNPSIRLAGIAMLAGGALLDRFRTKRKENR